MDSENDIRKIFEADGAQLKAKKDMNLISCDGGIPLGKLDCICGSTNSGYSIGLINMARKMLEQGKRVYFMDTELTFDNFEERLKRLTKSNSVCSKIPTPMEVEKSILAACEHTTKLIDEAEAEIKRTDEINAKVEAEAKATGGLGDNEC